MKKTKIISATTFTVFVLAGLMALTAYAKGKPSSPPGLSKQVLITVSGDIDGSGSDLANMTITFSDTFGSEYGSKLPNPDGSLSVYGTKRGSRTLSYYYCTDPDDESTYKRLRISGGTLIESTKNHETISFQSGSAWAIAFKSTGVVELEGTLATGVTYTEEEID